MKELSSAMKCHLVIMALLLIVCLVFGFMLIGGTGLDIAGMPANGGTGILLFGFMSLMNAIALGYGIFYFVKGYSKQVANYYRAFILIIAITTVVTIFAQRYIDNGTVDSSTLLLTQALEAVKCVLLLVLAFVPDLGKRNNWILFACVLILDIVIPCLILSASSLSLFVVVQTVTRIALDVTIGFAINAKYKDKEARGTK